ncbi:Asp domain-containing protein [Cephalotus follicularis]|uniref:Aspartic proteinase Asp1 n=1 Tax=Cephalotus follicularis TaxID=3775 RepID=A0A1Q3BVP8_CEPFO|nr:Asp domain-containing protein [Cephalotus follicularis]
MDSKGSKTMKLSMFPLLLLLLFSTFQGCFSQASYHPTNKKSTSNGFGSSVVFPLTGDVYPLGYYSAKVPLGYPPKLYDLDIDSGSDVTWVQCDAPCTGCTLPRDRLYKPKNNLVLCSHPLCSAVPNQPCENLNDQCHYEMEYADSGTTLGVLVNDSFPLRLTNSSVLSPKLTFGCGYDQKDLGPSYPSNTAGVLGLGNGKASIVSQLRAQGIIRNVVGHCLNGQGGGYLFFGDDLVPSSGVVWTPIRNNLENHYMAGPAELFIGGTSTGFKDLQLIFDSGSSYTYFNSKLYSTVVNLVKKYLIGKPLKEVKDRALPLCWKGSKAFKHTKDFKNYFQPLVLSFPTGRNVQLQMPPEAYLILTKNGNVCLGILHGTEVGLQSYNLIGDISLLDKMVIYDNEKMQIGWIPSNCNRLPNGDGDYGEDFCQPYAVNFGILEEHCPVRF